MARAEARTSVTGYDNRRNGRGLAPRALAALVEYAFDELSLFINPRWLAALMGIWFEIIKHANFPAFAYQQISKMRSDQACATGNERASVVLCHVTGRVNCRSACAKRLTT